MSNRGLSSLEIGSLPKFKPRKVSAVRDFPPGCGPSAKPVDLKFAKNDHVGTGVVEAGGIITSKGTNGVENFATADMESNRFQNSEIANSMEANAGLHNDFKNISMKEVIEAEGQNMKGLNGAKDLALVKYIGSEEVKPVMVIGGSQLLSSPKEPIFNDSVKQGTSVGHKDKFHRRRVSAVCDIPPSCGPNAPQPTKEGRQMISRGNGCVDGVKIFKVETDGTRTWKNLERGELMETRKISETQSVGGVEKDEVRTEATKTSRGKIGENVRRRPLSWQLEYKAFAKRSKVERDISGGPSMKKKAIPVLTGNLGALILRDKKCHCALYENPPSNSRASYATHNFYVSATEHSSHGDARNRVIETLRLFRSICRQYSQDETKSENQLKRIDLQAAKIIKAAKREVNTGRPILGEVPGVEVGDEFQYRVELAIVGIHRLYQTGIDSMKHNGISVANSIVDAGVYSGDKHNAEVMIYSGHGGNIVGKNKQPEDQKLERGNLALKNSISTMNPVRVIRGWKETNRSGKLVTMYVYDGLYTVNRYWQETGPHGKLVFMFELRRIPGQPKLRQKSKI
ncbi:histone-lysine N-methyltransferase, H3 lysine-9 specific SUVH6-like [Olea europaea var. sylvestris]|uniref:histone-lysine N-methyltransferase, H3 lysine-9 specific SUVH6-like n=1 Tax=Olea europaea var. sylvestris TaxID=158386 RepID=UPI000C1D7AB3|nr:histone-lysine N-methyltransferase, H3 lysine-9 specific SUVH6-like [Olea europaea var. sylvestris]